jgi:hypothetical protein
MAGLDPAIHVLLWADEVKPWITGSSPVMTIVGAEASRIIATLIQFSNSHAYSLSRINRAR